jgi:fatty acid desaturase
MSFPVAFGVTAVVGTLSWIGSIFPAIGPGLWFAILAWVSAMSGWFPIIGWYVELSEHFPYAAYERGRWATRHRACGPISRIFVGMVGEKYHLLHHIDPRIPYWNLRKAHRHMMLGNTRYREAVKAQGGDGWRIFGFSRQLVGLHKTLLQHQRSEPS